MMTVYEYLILLVDSYKNPSFKTEKLVISYFTQHPTRDYGGEKPE